MKKNRKRFRLWERRKNTFHMQMFLFSYIRCSYSLRYSDLVSRTNLRLRSRERGQTDQPTHICKLFPLNKERAFFHRNWSWSGSKPTTTSINVPFEAIRGNECLSLTLAGRSWCIYAVALCSKLTFKKTLGVQKEAGPKIASSGSGDFNFPSWAFQVDSIWPLHRWPESHIA